jgi:diguanylate cyclase (GGDEF)-like protein/PAS domain S-box-containing protein
MPAFFIQLRLSLGRVLILLFCLLVAFSFSDKVLAETEASPAKIRVAIDDNYPPYIMRETDNSLTGYLVDIWKLWETKTGVNVEIIAQDWDLAQQTMKNGGAEVIDTMFRTPQRELTLDYSQPYAVIPIAIYAHTEHIGITNISGLQGFQVGVKAGDSCVDRLYAAGITDLQPYASYELLLEAAIAEQVHVFCMDEPPANYLIFRAQASQLFNKSFTISEGKFHRAVHKGDAATLALVERGFAAITPAELKLLDDKWMGKTFNDPSNIKLIYGLLLALIGMTLLFGINVLLRQKVKQRTAELLVSKNQLETTLNAVPDLLFELDEHGRCMSFHFPSTALLNFPTNMIVGLTVKDVWPTEATNAVMAAITEAKDKGHSHGKDFKLALAGDIHWFELSVSHKLASIEATPSFIMILHDITEHKATQLKVERLSNIYAVLSQCNQAIVRCKNEDDLYRIICNDAVTFGGMKMAWIGLLDQTSQIVKPVASYGTGIEYLDSLEVSMKINEPSSIGPVATAIREARPVWCQDFQNDQMTALWHESAISYGWKASASLPIYCKGSPIGIFMLYADITDAFDVVAQNLLIEMAMDISYALGNFDNEAERIQNEIRQHKLATVVEQSANGILITDVDANIEYVNQAFVDMSGYSLNEIKGWNPRLLQSGKTLPLVFEQMWAQIKAGKSWRGKLINSRKDGTEYTARTFITPMFDTLGKITNYLSIKENITEQLQAEARIQHLAYFDQLTGLPNRIRLNDRFNYSISLAQRAEHTLTVMFFDLDHFKIINDTLGHNAGDQLLVELTRRFKTVLREEDTLSRMGGDEFILLLPETDGVGASVVAAKLLNLVAEPFMFNGNEIVSTISIGIALYPHDGHDVETLSKNADTAMYRVKKSGRNNFCFFTKEMLAHSTRILQLTNALRHALARDELELYYQPQTAMEDGRIIGAEALLRWQHRELGMISPSEFIPIAESSGLIVEIGEWVLSNAVKQLKYWLDIGLPSMMVAVNISAVQFRHPNLPELVSKLLDEYQLPPEYLELELTESVAMDEPIAAIAVMNDLHSRGVRMSIDDFGTGYSSLSYLKKFKVYKLKIDQSFVRDISTNADDKAIVTTIINMAGSLGMQTIAEGVETADQLEFLRLQGCDEIQGYYFSPPLSKDDFEAYARKKMT